MSLLPKIDPRREEEFLAEMQQLAQAWIPDWGILDSEEDYAHAIMHIAARYCAEVSERLDRAGDKMRCGLMDWLGIRGQAAIPARMPVVFRLTEGTSSSVLAQAPITLQADVQGASVVFETEADLNISPARIASIVASRGDTIYLPPPGLSSLDRKDAKPTSWKPKSLAPVGSTVIQVSPDIGLEPGMLIRVSQNEHIVEKVEGDLVTIRPPLESIADKTTQISAVDRFSPFDQARNWQEHALYLGDDDLFQLDSAATIEVNIDPASLPEGIKWQYWGKKPGQEMPEWQAMELDIANAKPTSRLAKYAGTIEELEFRGRKSRWIRAIAQVSNQLNRFSRIGVSINPTEVDSKKDRESTKAEHATPLRAEGMANSTPLVLENTFYPLGKEPKQFDAFYLGCEEAFSKKGATATLDFRIADGTLFFLSLAKQTGQAAYMAGIGNDLALHLFEVNLNSKVIKALDDPTRPPTAAVTNLVQMKLPAWEYEAEGSSGFFVAAFDGQRVWARKQCINVPTDSQWVDLGVVQDNPNAEFPLSSLARSKERLYLAAHGKIFTSLDNKTWTPIKSRVQGTVTSIVHVSNSDELNRTNSYGLIAICERKVFWLKDLETENIEPVLIGETSGRVICSAAVTAGDKPVFYYVDDDIENRTLVAKTIGSKEVTRQFPGRIIGIEPQGDTVLFSMDGQPHGSTWRVKLRGMELVGQEIKSDDEKIEGVPLPIADFVVVPSNKERLLTFHGAKFSFEELEFSTGVELQEVVEVGDLLARNVTTAQPVVKVVSKVEFTSSSGTITSTFTSQLIEKKRYLYCRMSAAAQPAIFVDNRTIQVEVDDNLQVDGFIFIDGIGEAIGTTHRVTSLVDGKATITPELSLEDNDDDGGAGDEGDGDGDGDEDATIELIYRNFKRIDGKVAHYFAFPKDSVPGWNANLLKSPLSFVETNGAIVTTQGRLFSSESDVKQVVILDELSIQPSNVVEFYFGEGVQWKSNLGTVEKTPELSWEYWNGTNWASLTIIDKTLHLTKTETATFIVPPDISPTDWSGKTNHWIRARLIGGDYGQEEVTILTKSPSIEDLKEDSSILSKQVVKRSRSGIQPPAVLRLDVSFGYKSNKGITPTYLLTEDSRSIRDQSDANRTEGAQVEAFVPLDVALSWLSRSNGTVNQNLEAVVKTIDSGFLFVGIDGHIAGHSFNLLILVDEQDYTDFAPLQVEALVANRFVPLVCSDQTRGLGETGLVRLLLTAPPTPAELFGQSLRWLRLFPKNSSNKDWQPKIRGVYINAVWASATETMTRELLGSSDGSPNLTVTLARPPILHNTLELRVQELLSENERKELQQQTDADPNRNKSDSANSDSSRPVVSNVENLPGDWVLWKQVTDPLDEAPNARVYSLDEESGVIRFGDGLHGMIPPIGKDSIVAFGYKRTEPAPAVTNGAPTPVPGNLIEPKTALNLVSPVSSVDAVFAADQSAGGVAAQSSAKVVKTGYASLRHRQRVLTVQDLEQRLLEFAPEAAQAKAIVSTGLVEVVVVNDGKNPQPTAQQTRAWKQQVLDCAAPWLSSIRTFRIIGPTVLSLKIELQVVIDSLDSAGSVAEEIKKRLTRYFDVSTGGFNQEGWMLGQEASEQDIALAIRAIPHVENLGRIRLVKVATQDGLAWPSKLSPKELVRLDEDFIQFEFLTKDSIRPAISASNLVGGAQ